jgi:GNAT superfamily N-acetyltransferase
MNGPLAIRDATPADLAFLVDANAAMALETEHKTLDRALLERGVSGVFEQPRRGFYLVARSTDTPVGCLLVTYEWSDWRNGDWWWLQSVYVQPTARRSGVFSALYAELGRRAHNTADCVGLRLYVEQDNAPAQATYSMLGMSPSGYRLYEHGFVRP